MNYEDFSDDEEVIKMIKRAEMYRNWADVEDIANGFETLQTNFENHRNTSSKAFEEMLDHIEKIKLDINEKTNATIDDISHTAKDIEQLNDDLRKIQNFYQNQPKMDDIQNVAQQVRDINSENEVRLNNAI